MEKLTNGALVTPTPGPVSTACKDYHTLMPPGVQVIPERNVAFLQANPVNVP